MALSARSRPLGRVPLALFVAALTALARLGAGGAAEEPGPAPDQALKAALAAGDWLARTQREDGAYAYLYDPVSNTFSQKGYSFVRHAGVVWSLLELHGQTGRPAYLQSAERGLARLEREVRWEGDVAYVVSRESAPLGGAALAVVAYLALPDLSARQRDLAAGLGQMILRLQRPDGSFRSHYPVRPPLRTKEIRSLYYPGEALLALTRLYTLTGERRSQTLHSLGDGAWLEGARSAGRYLAKHRDQDLGYLEPPPDHWYVIAAAELVPLLQQRASEPEVGPAERRALEADVRDLRDYAFKVAEVLVVNQVTAERARHPDYVGGPNNYDPPRSAPAATRGEALAAACRLAEASGRPRDRYLAALRGYARFILRLQHRTPAARAFPQPDNALGAFAASPADPRTRMDYQQHGISCLLGLRSLTRWPGEGN